MSMKKFTKKMLAIVCSRCYDNGNGNAGNGSGSNNDRHKKIMQRKPISARPTTLRWEKQRHLALLLHRLWRGMM